MWLLTTETGQLSGFRTTRFIMPMRRFVISGCAGCSKALVKTPDYPANVLCIRALHDGGIHFGKGNDKYLLTAEQALQLCRALSDCAYSLESRSWRIWDKMIEWRPRANAYVVGQTPEERALFNHLISYKPRRKSKRNAR